MVPWTVFISARFARPSLYKILYSIFFPILFTSLPLPSCQPVWHSSPCAFYSAHTRQSRTGIRTNTYRRSDLPGYQRIFGDRIVDNAKGDGVENVLDLMTDRGYEATMKAAAAQKKMGADVIALSCTGMSSIRIAPSIEKPVGIPVLDPVLCEGLLTLFELLRRENMED